jgi:DNA adenine methylase
LRNTSLVAGDFAKTLERVKRGDFVYLDPPYAVSSRRIFRQYGKQTFDVSDIPRLSEWLDEIVNRGADFLVSYADCSEARTLASCWSAARYPIRRHIAGFAGSRRHAYEWLISNRAIQEVE